MTWDARIGVVLLTLTFVAGYMFGSLARWEERVRDRRRARLIERLGRERSPW